MKLTKTIFIIIAVLFAVVGIALVSTALVMANGDFILLSTRTPYVDKEYAIKADEIKQIDLDIRNVKIHVVSSNDDKIHFNYSENEKEYYVIDVSENGKLSVSFKTNMKWYDHVGLIYTADRIFEIAIPENANCDLSLKTSDGKITADSLILKGDLSLKTSSSDIVLADIEADGIVTATTSDGDVTASHLKSQEFSAKSSSGKMILTDVSCSNNLAAETSDGKINADRISIMGDLALKTSSSDIVLSDINAAGVTVSTSDGDVSASKLSAQDFSAKDSSGKLVLIDVSCTNILAAETSDGEINISNISVGAGLKLKSNSGKIAGTIRGSMEEFNIVSHTSGDEQNSLPENHTGGNKSLEINTSDDEIDIVFVK